MTTQFFIVTGLSGAGKSQALKILEDLGFFCVDNLPLALLPKFADLHVELQDKRSKVAIGIDIRAGQSSLASLQSILDTIARKGIKYTIVFFTASDDTLLHRYSETRRRHPVGKRIVEGIRKERKLLEKIYSISDKEIDTSNLTLGEFKEILAREMNIRTSSSIAVSLVSFGYKYGIPLDADIVMDVRFLPNPNYIPKLRHKTGKNIEVKRYIKRQKTAKMFFGRFYGMIRYLLPYYIKEGKSHLTLAIGCTGGRHRSVMITEDAGNFLKSLKYPVYIYHRDVERINDD